LDAVLLNRIHPGSNLYVSTYIFCTQAGETRYLIFFNNTNQELAHKWKKENGINAPSNNSILLALMNWAKNKYICIKLKSGQMRKLYVVLIIVVVAILVGVFIFLKMFNKEVPKTENLRTDKSVTVEKITSDFQSDSAKARKTYNSNVKVIDLKGKVSKVVPDAGGNVHIYFKANHVNVDCLVQKDNTDAASKLKENEEVNIKGKYNGYTYDEMIDSLAQLQLNDCIIQK
jgi:uncharacterized protein (UPF0333 family)